MRSRLNSSILRFCSLFVLTLCLYLLLLSGHGFQGGVAHASRTAELVQQGVEAYRQYQYSDAIRVWQQVLDQDSEELTIRDRATVWENLARAQQQQGKVVPALESWKKTTAIYRALNDPQQVGRTLTAQAQTYHQLGQPLQAINLLCGYRTTVFTETPAGAELEPCTPGSAVTLTQQGGNLEAQVAALGSLGETYRTLQNYEIALGYLNQGLALLHPHDGDESRALLLNSLGNTYREQAELNYQRAVASLRSGSGDEGQFYVLAAEARRQALTHLTESRKLAQKAQQRGLEIRALLGLMAVYTHTGNTAKIAELRHQALPALATLPPTQETAYLALQLVQKKQPLTHPDGTAIIDNTYQSSRSRCLDLDLDTTTRALIERADAIAETLKHRRLKAFSQGELGHFHECHGNYDAALEYTQSARLAASSDRVLALDTLYLWQWQSGRVYQRLGQSERAVGFYRQAVTNLNRIRDEILASNQTLQFDFRDAVAPVYRELAEIQLTSILPTLTDKVTTPRLTSPPSPANASEGGPLSASASSAPKGRPTALGDSDRSGYEQTIRQVLSHIDSLQLAELQNYFGSDCVVPVAEQRLDEIIRLGMTPNSGGVASTAIISTVIFPDKTALILTLPDQIPQLYWVNLSETALRRLVVTFRNSLEDIANELEGYDTQLAEALYQHLIGPFASELQRSQISNLVFVHDGILRNIPMAALHDGEQYLLQQYTLSSVPAFQRIELATKTTELQALVLGLTRDPIVNGQGLGPLPAVRREVQDVISLLPGSELLLDEALTRDNLQQKLQKTAYPVLHIATHGKFGTDPKETFLVLGAKERQSQALSTQPAENQRLLLGELDRLIRQGVPREELLELIVLSACQTASGDERSTLGLAGTAIRAGAKSALASLWSVSDEATADLMTAFYDGWTQGLGKAAALRVAQMQVMETPKYLQHPAYWAAFELVGAWN